MSYLKIITLNCGLMDYGLFGLTIFSNPPYSNKRISFIPNSIKNQNADIVALQECFNIKYTQFIIDELKQIYPYYAFYNTKSLTKLSNGLVFLSKYPIEESQFIEYDFHATLEAMCATKGFLKCSINIPIIGKINFINLHTTSFGNPNKENKLLNYQINQILS
jgi:endonuclease/exonuclease/phosphatase family metal-dependent hydrolase